MSDKQSKKSGSQQASYWGELNDVVNKPQYNYQPKKVAVNGVLDAIERLKQYYDVTTTINIDAHDGVYFNVSCVPKDCGTYQ